MNKKDEVKILERITEFGEMVIFETGFKYNLLLFVFLLISKGSFGQILTKGEVYDLYPGDKYAYYFGVPYGPEEFRFIKVLDRQMLGQDTLKISYFRASYKYVPFQGYFRFVDSFIGVYSNLNETIFPGFTQNDTIIYYHKDSTHPNYQVRDSMYFDSCGNWYNYRHVEEWTGLSGSTTADSFAVNGTGLFIYYISDPGGGGLYGHTDHLMYYNKHLTHTCGSAPQFPLAIESASVSPLIFYPNPSADFVKFELEDVAFYTIHDASGKLIEKGKSTDGIIDIHQLLEGTYNLSVITENKVQSGILVKR